MFVQTSSACVLQGLRTERVAWPEAAFLLSHEAVTLPCGACSHRACMAPVLAGDFNRRAMPSCSQQVIKLWAWLAQAAVLETKRRAACKPQHARQYLYNIVLL